MTRRILLIDDSRTARQIVRRVLVAAGYDVVEAADGAEGLARIQDDHDLSLVVCDVNMPNMTGLELLGAVRAAGRDEGFVMLTSECSPKSLEAAEALGARAWLRKPIRPEGLLAAVAHALNFAC